MEDGLLSSKGLVVCDCKFDVNPNVLPDSDEDERNGRSER